ncbi:TetR family transcriptional regulator [Streptomyces sp. NPDC006458]|uniref:TetR/AcrR family transcriptional regulator n=1 Tax=Streptomyces sp. NPDC006458 TaxID=3154302 RepID=UPI0033B0562E
MDIARAAAGLFVSRGLKATRAEDIAQVAGIAPRTFYRYFASKEEAVAPLYAAGAQRWAEAVREAPAGLDLPQALEHAVRHTLQPGVGVSAASWEWVRTLIRLADSSPALRKVWAEVCQASEETLGEVLVERAGVRDAGDSADGVTGEVAGASGADGVTGEVTGASGADGGDNVARSDEGVGAEGYTGRRFLAAVAGAAVRTAVQEWAAGDAPPGGARGPAALALRNLEALKGFDWRPR